MTAQAQLRRRTGRPLSFDRDAVLERAMHIFWEHGYETTSLSHLTSAMGISPPSIYAAFGDKKRLFLEAVRLYMEESTVEQVIEGSASVRDAVRNLLEGSAIRFTGETTPRGCLLGNSALTGSPESADVRHELTSFRNQIEAVLRKRIARAIREGELPADADADTLAALTTTTIQGMSTLARDGASREKLLRIVAASLHAWP